MAPAPMIVTRTCATLSARLSKSQFSYARKGEPRRSDESADGLESPADGYNIVRGLIARGHSDATIRKIAGQNSLNLLRRVIG